MFFHGCGFHPLYSEHPSNPTIASHLASIKLPSATDKRSYDLVHYLTVEFRLSDPSAAPGRYSLTLHITETASEFALAGTGVYGRVEKRMECHYALIDTASKKELFHARAMNGSSYDISGTPLGQNVADERITQQILHDIAIEIRARLEQYFTQEMPHGGTT